MKRYILILTLGWFGTAQAQIPVTDGASIGQQAVEFVQTALRFTQEVKERADQLTQLKAEFNSITGTRNLGAIFDNPLLKQSLPPGLLTEINSMNTTGYAGMSAISKAEYHQIHDACSSLIGQSKINCEASAIQGAQSRAVAKNGLSNSDLRFVQLDQLMSRINTTTDTKGIQELSARISVEQARIATDQLKLNQYNLAQASSKELLRQQRKETIKKELAAAVANPPHWPIPTITLAP